MHTTRRSTLPESNALSAPLALAAWILAAAPAFGQVPQASGAKSAATSTATPATPPKQEQGMPAIPKTPAMVLEIVEAVPFELSTPYEHTMRKERPSVARGHILVVRSTEAMVVPRQVAEPVLLAGDARGGQTAERINTGIGTGLLVVIVPEWTVRGEDGSEQPVDPLSTRLYFATPELPERVDAGWIAAEGAKADAAALPATAPRATGLAPAARLVLADRDALGRVLADIVERHAPSETDRIEALRATD